MENNISENQIQKKKWKRWSAGKWLLLIALLLVVLAAVPVINEMVPQKVTVRYITFSGDVDTEYTTRAHRVSDFLSEHKYEIADDDMVLDLYEKAAMEPTKEDVIKSFRRWLAMVTGKSDKDEPLIPFDGGFSRTAGDMRASSGSDLFIANDMTIKIKKAEEKTASIGGEKTAIKMYPGTVENTLESNGIKWDEDDVIKPELSHELGFDDTIRITRVKVVVKEKKESIEPKEADAVFDRSLASGTIVRTQGKPGKAVYKYTYKFVNGKKKKTKKEFDHWIRKPTDIQLRFGTSVTGESGKVEFSETFTGNCTAYYFGKNAHGATGQKCHYGTCAVDPKVIPYGTKLYVEGYGTAVANDCGGAVKGHIIDLYMRSTKECFKWGRRNKKVYVLE